MGQTIDVSPKQPEQPVAPAVEQQPVTESVSVPVQQPAVDRSAYNCVACGGEGLKDQQTLCPVCHGTGKV